MPGSPGRRRKPAGGDPIEGLGAPPPRRKRSRRKSKRGGSDSGGRRGKLLPILLGALGVAVVALVVVLVIQFTSGGGTEQAVPNSYRVYTSGETTEVLGDREIDPRPLAEQEVFERGNDEIDSQGMTFTLAAQALTDDCAQAVWGERVVQALQEADCSQVARAGYTSEDHVGVAAILKLRDTEAARAVAQALEPAGEEDPDGGFLLPPSEEEPFDRLGAGYSAAEATVNGHYLVVTWTQSLSSTSPEQRENLSAPLIALGNFDFPLFRRLLEHEDAAGTGTEGTTGTDPGTTDPGTTTGTDATTGVDGGTGTGVTDGTGTGTTDGTGTGTGLPTG
ncbi:hypothetical protein [Marinitenerispora sediminis]|uniref:hypothetical protein n=1 Tax=Marinitenerispora sediminis TaxID=1931232 RepID=UPI001F3A5915|nr:hypothetical protein [Marinitenerispora sediminis]